MNSKLNCKPSCHIERSRDAMNQKSPYFLFFFLFFSINTFLNAQTENDSLAKYSYEELHALIDSTKFDKQELSKLYTKEYLRRAKLDRDNIKASRGYFYLMHYNYLKNNYDKTIKYSDSIIDICGECEHEKYPALGYYFKAAVLNSIGQDRDAIDYYLIALDFAKKNKNTQLEIDLRREIVGLKSNYYNNEEVLKFYLENLKFIKRQKDYKIKYQEDYFLGLYNLSVEYIENKNYEESLIFSNEGIKESLIYNDSTSYYDFIFLSSISQFHLRNFRSSLKNFLKLKFNDKYGYRKISKEIITNYYLGKIYNKLKQPEKAQHHFLKTDSIYQATKDVFPEMRIAYEHIIAYYKNKNDLENQIKYYDRLLEVDKIIDSTYTYVTETINKKFDTPQAIAERARLVEELESNKNSWKYSFGGIAGVLVVVLGILTAVYRRQKQYKQRFENIMSIERSRNALNAKSSTSIQPNKSVEALESEKNTSASLSVKKDIGISETIVQNILKGLADFERIKGFIQQVTLTELAKELQTNPKYLSKVINWHYQKNFTSYINELRVQYAISKLKEETTFRNYTIKAIAKEVGFKSAESFSKTFYKITGIYPSYFIKQLQKRLED